VTEADAKGRPLRGVVAEASVDAKSLTIREAVLSNVRVLRDYQILGQRPEAVAATPERHGGTLVWKRDRLDGAAGYHLALEVLDGEISGGDGAPLVLTAPAGKPLRVRLTVLTGETPLTPLDDKHLLTAAAGSDARARGALTFLSYHEKFLAGSWRFDTYFGRDTLMSVRLLMPALTGEAVESGIGSVLARLAPNGEVAHEEDIGEFAVLRHQKEGKGLKAEPIFDYGMVDDDFMLAPVAAEYLLRRPEGRARATAFLAGPLTGGGSASGETQGAALVRNLLWVTQAARPFAVDPVPARLIALKDGRSVGQWRDSQDGLAGGRYAYDVNAVFVPAALQAIAQLKAAGLLTPYLTADQARDLDAAAGLAATWSQAAPPLFAVSIDPATARSAVEAYAASQGVPAAPALASLPVGPLTFNALSLDAAGKPIPVIHSDDGFDLLFLDPRPEALERAVAAMARPFPAGLMTDVGLLVANPVFADPAIQAKLGPGAYHGTVVWSWQQAVFAAGLDRQLARADLPPVTRRRLTEARTGLWKAIDAAQAVRTSELWSWSFADGKYVVEPFGQRGGDQDESNAAQLWSTVFLALKPR
jgi:glycogen debranching enzyme